MNKKTKVTLISLALAALFLALNIGAAFIPDRFLSLDTTSSSLYSISSESRGFLSKLDENITLSVLNSDGTQPKLEAFLEEYASASDKLSLEYVNTASEQGFLSAHGIPETKTVNPYSIIVSSEKRSELIDIYSLFYYSNSALGVSNMSQSDYNYYYQLFSSSESYIDYLNKLVYESELYFCGEMMLTTVVEYVTVEYIPHSYFLSGHGEDDGNFTSMLSQMGYEYGELDITKTDSIPPDADCIVINSPTEDYSEAETEMIMNFLRDGGRLLLVTCEKNLSMTNLMSIAEYYGMSASEGLVAENAPASDSSEGESEDEGEEYDIYSIIPTVNIDHDSMAIFPTDKYSVTIKNANSVKISDSLRPSQLVTPILTSSDKAYIGSADNTGKYALAAAAEEETDGKNTRLVWFTGADSFNAKESSEQNLSLLVYSISWMSRTYESEVGNIEAKLYDDALLSASGTTATAVGAVLIVIIPAAVALAGALIIHKRKKA